MTREGQQGGHMRGCRRKAPGAHGLEMRRPRGRRLERPLISELRLEARRSMCRMLAAVTSHEPQHLPLLANGYNRGCGECGGVGGAGGRKSHSPEANRRPVTGRNRVMR